MGMILEGVHLFLDLVFDSYEVVPVATNDYYYLLSYTFV